MYDNLTWNRYLKTNILFSLQELYKILIILNDINFQIKLWFAKTLNQFEVIMKKIIIIISIYIFYTINAFSENLPQTKLYAVIDGSCCVSIIN